MESKRCTSLTVLLVLIALETILVDFVCTACDHSKPSGDWVNDYDGLVDYDCGTGYSISRIRSYHRDCIEDRLWAFSCQSNVAAQHCSWSEIANDYDGRLDFTCPHNGFITGIYSWHSNSREDRRFQFRCCHSHSHRRWDCRWSLQTSWDAQFTYRTHHGYYLAGIFSYHNDYYEDRRWQFYSCRKY